jgi:hypothetical protein
MPVPSEMRSLGMDTGTAAPPGTAYTKVYAYDESNQLVYMGWAQSYGGPTTSTAIWAVKKLTWAGGLLTKEEWADGDTLENNIWDNRASLTYK